MCKTRSVSLKEHFQAIRAISGIDFGLEESF